MKTSFICFLLLFFFFGCKKTEIITIPLLPCDCQNLPIAEGYVKFNAERGMIFFPKLPTRTYSVLLIDNLTSGDILNIFSVCSDSTFTTLLKLNKIADSTIVKFNGGFVSGTKCDYGGYFGLSMRITSMTKEK